MSALVKFLNQKINTSKLSLLWSLTRLQLSIGLLWLFTVSALIGFSLGHLDWFIPKTPINLLLGFVLLIINVPIASRKGLGVFALSFLVGMTMEIIGVKTEAIFGTYYYGDNLGFKILDVPLMIGVYWGVLVIVTSQMAKSVFDSYISQSLLGASLMVSLDFLMEHLAARFDFWHFSGGIAGVQNYIAWFVIAFALHLFANKYIPKGGTSFSFHLYFNQVAFFLLSYIFLSWL